jgi:hypothetical protein
MCSLSGVLVLLLTMLALDGVLAVAQMRYDNQYSWVRSGWQDTKLTLYVQDALARSIGKTFDVDEATLSSSMLGMLAAPHWAYSMQQNGWRQGVSLNPLEMIHVANASKLLHCEMCNYLAAELWRKTMTTYHRRWTTERPANWLDAMLTSASPDADALTKETCNTQWMNTWLHNKRVLHVQLQDDADNAQALQHPKFALCTRAVKEKVSDPEVAAATLACQVCS